MEDNGMSWRVIQVLESLSIIIFTQRLPLLLSADLNLHPPPFLIPECFKVGAYSWGCVWCTASEPSKSNETQTMELEYVRLTTVKMRRCGDNRKRFTPPPVEKHVRVCNESSCLIWSESVPLSQLHHSHITSEITGCGERKQEGGEGEGARRRRRRGHEILRRIPFNIG